MTNTLKQQRRKSRRQKAKDYSKKKEVSRASRADQIRIDSLMKKIITPADTERIGLLSEICFPYNPDTENFSAIAKKDVAEMEEVLGVTRMGVGLAASQLGIMRRALVWKKTPVSEMKHMLNPVVESLGEESQSMFEGCLSYPGHIAEVERPVEATISWIDLKGEKHSNTFSGWEARIILHEIDHLNGICRVGSAPEEDRKYVGSEKKQK